jgi:hypothetical protein
VTTHLYRPAHTSIGKVNDVERESAIRMYCSQSGTTWTLQVRGPFRHHGGHGDEGKDFIVASASLSRADLLALRRAIDAELKAARK